MKLLRNVVCSAALALAGGLTVPQREEGQTLVEYALILVLIAVAVIFAVTFLSGKIQTVFSSIGNAL